MMRGFDLATQRMRLRRLRFQDLDSLCLLESNPDITKFTSMRVPQTREQTQTRLERHLLKQKAWEPLGIWIAEDKNTHQFVGWFMLVPNEQNEYELGYMVLPQYWGFGYTTEICAVILDFALKTGLKKIIAKTDHQNYASIRVLEKLKFKEDKNAQDKSEKRFVFEA